MRLNFVRVNERFGKEEKKKPVTIKSLFDVRMHTKLVRHQYSGFEITERNSISVAKFVALYFIHAHKAHKSILSH